MFSALELCYLSWSAGVHPSTNYCMMRTNGTLGNGWVVFLYTTNVSAKTIKLNWDFLKILSRKVLITNHTHTWEIPWEFLNEKLELEKGTRLLNGQPRSLMQQPCRTSFFRKWGPAVQWRIIPRTAFPNLFSLIEVQTWPFKKNQEVEGLFSF